MKEKREEKALLLYSCIEFCPEYVNGTHTEEIKSQQTYRISALTTAQLVFIKSKYSKTISVAFFDRVLKLGET